MVHIVIVGGGIAAVTCVERLLQLREDAMQGRDGELAAALASSLRLSLVAPSAAVKQVTDVQRLSAHRISFRVSSSHAAAMRALFAPSTPVRFLQGTLTGVDVTASTIRIAATAAMQDADMEPAPSTLRYDRLLLATGATPASPLSGPRVHVLRDTESMDELRNAIIQQVMENEGRLMVVGNGGIAMEVIQALSSSSMFGAHMERVVWVVKDSFLGNTFLDPAASAFLMPRLFPHADPQLEEKKFGEEQWRKSRTGAIDRERKAAADGRAESLPLFGGALGPHWQEQLRVQDIRGDQQPEPSSPSPAVHSPLTLHLNTVVTSSAPSPSPASVPGAAPLLRVELSNGAVYSVSLLVSATGVLPNTDCVSAALQLDAEDGGVSVSSSTRSSTPRVYAAGDCASPDFTGQPHFVHLRLWSQARSTGIQAAQAMWEDTVEGRGAEGAKGAAAVWRSAERDMEDDERVPFGVFVHDTQLMGERVVLLGLFNEAQFHIKQRQRRERRNRGAQPVDECPGGEEESEDELRVLMRVRPQSSTGESGEFVKVLMTGGRVQGCTLIGETGMDELLENLIATQLDLRAFGDDWLHADVDLNDFFD